MRNKTHRTPFLRPGFAAATALFLGSAVTAQHTVDAVNGGDAVRELGNRLAEVADRHGMAPDELSSLLHDDDTLWLFENDRLVYVDTAVPGIAQAPVNEPVAMSGIPLEDAFFLETDPGADRTIYLDFDGHHSVNNGWGHNILFPPYNIEGNSNDFTSAELVEIIAIWKHVAEDFAPWNVNVTTMDPGIAALTRSNGGDQTYGVRCIMTQPTNGFGNGIGGVAMLNSFDDSIDNPVFVFNKGDNNGSMSASHEVGHSLGLVHDGLFGLSYHPGTTTGAISWGPIMGAPFDMIAVQWSKGEYEGATSLQDDLLFIGSYIPLRADEHGDTEGTATVVTECSTTFNSVIGEPDEVDLFTFTTPEGIVAMNAFPAPTGPNLDIQLTLTDDQGAEVFVFNLTGFLWAAISYPLDAGQYFLEIDGVGLATGEYTDYGSLGQYSLTIETPACDCAGDITGDGMVGIDDFLDLLANWGPCVGCPADLDGDGTVGIQDFLDLLAAWGDCP